MPDNQGLSHLSDHLLIVAVVLYSLAVIAFAADFAFGRRSPVVTRAKAEVPGRVPAGVAAGASAARRVRPRRVRPGVVQPSALRRRATRPGRTSPGCLAGRRVSPPARRATRRSR